MIAGTIIYWHCCAATFHIRRQSRREDTETSFQIEGASKIHKIILVKEKEEGGITKQHRIGPFCGVEESSCFFPSQKKKFGGSKLVRNT